MPIFVAFSAMFIVGVLTGAASVRCIAPSPGAVVTPERAAPKLNRVVNNRVVNNRVVNNGGGCGFPKENDRY